MGRAASDAESSARRRGESTEEVLDRNVNELLQEVRVAQTGVQLLFAFLLSLVFQQRFTVLTAFDRGTYVVALMTSALAALSFIAPVPYHRTLFRQGKKRQFVAFADRAVLAGLGFLLIGIVSALLLVLDVVLGRPAAVAGSGLIAVVGLVGWWLVPLRHRLTGR